MLGHRAALTLATAIAALSIEGCDPNPSNQALGSWDITTSNPIVEKDFATVDGWSVKYDRLLVNVSAVEVATPDGLVGDSAGPQIIDQVALGTKSLLSSTIRTARAWEAFSFQIGPAVLDPEAETTFAKPVTQEQVTMMQKDGLSIYVEGKMSKAGVEKTFSWGFSTDTIFSDCREGTSRPAGIVVPANGNDTANILMSGEKIFSDSLVSNYRVARANAAREGGVLRGDAIAAADADGDNVVTLDELHAVTIETAQTLGGQGAYVVVDGAPSDLGAFLEGRARDFVTQFRVSGTCKDDPAPTAE